MGQLMCPVSGGETKSLFCVLPCALDLYIAGEIVVNSTIDSRQITHIYTHNYNYKEQLHH